jgi:hypothetical protein
LIDVETYPKYRILDLTALQATLYEEAGDLFVTDVYIIGPLDTSI